MTQATTRPVCSVVIPSYNGRHLLEICLASIQRNLPQSLAVEVIVCDDASTDGTCDWLATDHSWVRVLRLEQNGGFVAAANAGIAAARGEVIQLLNNDTEVLPRWIEAGLQPFSDAKVGSVAPLVMVRSDPGKVDSAGDGYSILGWPFKRGHGEASEHWSKLSAGPVFGASGSSAFYRARALEKVGGYDPAFGSYYEDVDLAFRLRWAGYSCWYAPDSRVLHEVSASYDHAKPSLQRRMARNAELLFWSNLPPLWLLVAFWPHVGFTVLQALVRAAKGRLRPFLAGKYDALKLARGFRKRRRLRSDLAMKAIARPHFPLRLTPFREFANHTCRPREASNR